LLGDVYRGYWNDEEVALKKLKGKRDLTEFYAEGKLLKSLTHGNILRFYGIFQHSTEEQYMVTELMEQSLECLLRGECKPSLLQLIQIARDVTKGMIYLQSRRIIHRDLAARNILVKEGDSRYVVKIGDFGLGRVLNAAHYSIRDQIPRKYTSPEALMTKKYTPQSDVWCFGILMFEIMSYGRVPYEDMDNREVVAAVTKGYRLPCPNSCPKALYDVMFGCWHTDPNERPSFLDLHDRLAVLENQIPTLQEFEVLNDSTNAVQVLRNDDGDYIEATVVFKK